MSEFKETLNKKYDNIRKSLDIEDNDPECDYCGVSTEGCNVFEGLFGWYCGKCIVFNEN